QVLLIFRKGLWDLPKGKKEKGEAIKVCARREVAEETGISLPAVSQFLMKTVHQYKRDGHLYVKETHWFKMTTSSNSFTPQLEEGITKVEWVDIQEAMKKVGYKNLEEVLQKVQ